VNWSRTHRKAHSWAALLASLPLLVVIVTGLLLQVKKEVVWVQPPVQKGVSTVPSVSLQKILDSAMSKPEAGVHGWADVDRVDIRPSHGMAKVRSVSGWEVQVDTETGLVLQTAYRRSDFIEAMHDGSFFHPAAKLWVFLPACVLLLILWITGLYLWIAPRLSRYLRRPATQTA